MPKERKSPQEKKQLEYARDHSSGGFNSSTHGFAKGWRRKKSSVNRQYRHKAQELLVPMKPGLEATEAEKISEEITTAQLQKSVSRKRLKKIGVLPMGERVRQRLHRRTETEHRRGRAKQRDDLAAEQAIRTLSNSTRDELVEIVNRTESLRKGTTNQGVHLVPLSRRLVEARDFLYRVSIGSGRELDALRRNPQLNREFSVWIKKANKIMRKAQRTQDRKLKGKEAQRQRVKNLRKTSSESNLSPAPRLRTSE